MSDPVPLSESALWGAQRDYYERSAGAAFADVPHQVLDNPFVAAAYARVVIGFVRDAARAGTLDPAEPLHVVELGAGAGRFAHGMVRELGARLDALPFETPPLRYVMTDLPERTVAGWEADPLLDDARLDFARFDVTADATLALRRSGVVLERVANPLVVVANYLFDSVPADAFAVGAGTLEECLAAGGEPDAARRPVAAGHYGDPDLDALLAHYRASLADTVVTVPRAALGCLGRLRALAGDGLLVLAGDKAHSTEEALAYRERVELTRHAGAFSLTVNFHALAWYARRHGGEALVGGDRHADVDVLALLFGGDHAETRAAYADAVERFSPGDLLALTEGAERDATRFTVPGLVALLRLNGWDAFTLHGVAGALRAQAAGADPAAQEDLRQALYEIDERHFAVAGEDDLPFTIATILFELGDYEDALEFFQASLEQHGPHPATERNIALCEAELG